MSRQHSTTPPVIVQARLNGVLSGVLGVNQGPLKIFIYALGLLIFIGLDISAIWTAIWSGIQRWGSSDDTIWASLLAVILFLSIIIAIMIWWATQPYDQTKPILDSPEHITVHGGVILTLSELNLDVLDRTKEALENKTPIETLFSSVRHSWQQSCRALKPHGYELNWVGVVLSQESAGQYEDFKKVVGAFMELKPNVRFDASDPVSLDHAGKVMEAILKLMDTARTQKNLGPEQISIDVTGGLKPATVAGVMAGLARDVTLQYVNTNDPFQVIEVAYREDPHLAGK